jgi:cobalt-precorrin 5A hydrolase
MEKKNIMENNQDSCKCSSSEPKINLMGSQVVEGYECKPKVLDPNKPIMHYKTMIYVCTDERCKAASKCEDKAKDLREILKEINLQKGANRIKITRNSCQGACRFRQVMQINENTKANGYEPNNGVWLKNTHKFSYEQYAELFETLASCKPLDKFKQINMKVYE